MSSSKSSQIKYVCPVCTQVACSTVFALVKHLMHQHMEDSGVTEPIHGEVCASAGLGMDQLQPLTQSKESRSYPNIQDAEINTIKVNHAKDLQDREATDIQDKDAADIQDQNPNDIQDIDATDILTDKSEGTNKDLDIDIKEELPDEPLEDKPKPPKSMLCHVCLKSFSQKGNLVTHIRLVHEGRREFKCKTCSKSFGRKAHLKSHVETVHLDRKDYQCDRCSVRYGCKGDLVRHIKRVHELRRDFHCDVCPKKFADRRGLFRHMKGVHKYEVPK